MTSNRFVAHHWLVALITIITTPLHCPAAAAAHTSPGPQAGPEQHRLGVVKEEKGGGGGEGGVQRKGDEQTKGANEIGFNLIW